MAWESDSRQEPIVTQQGHWRIYALPGLSALKTHVHCVSTKHIPWNSVSLNSTWRIYASQTRAIIDSDNGLSFISLSSNYLPNDGIFWTEPKWIRFRWVWIKINPFPLAKNPLEMKMRQMRLQYGGHFVQATKSRITLNITVWLCHTI